jgi:hypothetical protein
MKHVLMGVALVAALGAAPAIAKERNTQQGAVTPQPGMIGNTDNMFKNPDGTLQGKPVVQGPANWAHVRDSSASSGASSGESGSSESGSRSK